MLTSQQNSRSNSSEHLNSSFYEYLEYIEIHKKQFWHKKIYKKKFFYKIFFIKL